MANTLKDLAASVKVVGNAALEQALSDLKTYIDGQDLQIQGNLDTLIGAQAGDVDKLLNTFNDIKTFLADYSEDDTLQSLLNAVNTAIGNEATRAGAAETALGARITTLENVNIMTAQEATTLFNSVFHPAQAQS